MFKGYCVAQVLDRLETMPSVKLSSIVECVNYVMLHKNTFREVLIEDEDEYIILHAVDGKVVYPKEVAEKFKHL